ncbi:hypothetical protein [Methanobrevibacter sp.]|uniref:hypothetical protein n=1 Tax=Methanobrevibacter sp. TaxID=66852 RepID=UPI00388F9EFC
MKKSHVSIISLLAIALLACVCTSCIYASENADILTYGDVDFTVNPTVIGSDDGSGTVPVEFDYAFDTHGKDISATRAVIHEVISRPGGESYKWVGEVDIDSGMNSGSFVKELETNKAYSMKLMYKWDGIDWDTYGSVFYI